MFAPTKTFRRWHRKVNINQKRYAVVSALAASALPSLVQARGHRISQVQELPLVLSDSVQSVGKTRQAVKILSSFGAIEDVDKAKASRKIRRGKGKMRNRRFVARRGPLIVYEKDNGITLGFRNIPGVELAQVDRLNLLQLAPGGHLGRFIIWTQGAFSKLNALYGSGRVPSSLKTGYNLPQSGVTSSDLARIINSDEIQSVLKPAKPAAPLVVHKKNPLRNPTLMARLNPHAPSKKRNAILAEERAKETKAALLAAKRTTEQQKARTTKRKAGRAFAAKLTQQPPRVVLSKILDLEAEAAAEEN